VLANTVEGCNCTLVNCTTMDTIGGRGKDKTELTGHNRIWILNCNVTLFTKEKALPGFVLLYVGMPMVLCLHNLFTILKITNGSQGYVRKIQMYCLQSGHDCASCVLVEFPDSPVKLPNLPIGWYPIELISWTF
jgi:hypothetical protein